MTAAFVFWVGLLVVAYLVVAIVPLQRRVLRLNRELKIERTRAHWAEARAGLFRLVQEEKISVDSSTFRCFYGLQTFILRRPEEYQEISRRIVSVLNFPPRELPTPDPYLVTWITEIEAWPEEMGPVIESMSAGTVSLVLAHGGITRLLFFLARHLPATAMLNSRTLLERVSRWLGDMPGTRLDRELIQTASRMTELRNAA